MKVGLHEVDEATYHAGRELSSTGAKSILRCPAEFAWERTHPVEKDTYDVGTLAHRLILGKGAPVWVADCTQWTRKVDQTTKKDKRAEGFAVVHRDDLRAASRMKTAVHRHPEIGPIFTTGAAEQSAYATDPETQTGVRCRPDWLTETGDGRAVCVDVKTTAGATHPEDLLGRYGVIKKLGYHQSAAWYIDTLALIGIEAQFLLVFVSKSEPHEPRAVSLDADTIAEGRALNRAAIETYARCTQANEWPCAHPAFIQGSIYERTAL